MARANITCSCAVRQLQETEARRDALQTALEAAQADLRQLAAALQQASQVGAAASFDACQQGGTTFGADACVTMTTGPSRVAASWAQVKKGTGGCVGVTFWAVTAVRIRTFSPCA